MLMRYADDHEERYQAKQTHYCGSKNAGEEPFDHEFDHAAERHVYVATITLLLFVGFGVSMFPFSFVFSLRFDRFTRDLGGKVVWPSVTSRH